MYIDELLNNKGILGKLKSFFGWIALISGGILASAVLTLQYVGVYVVYICIPVCLVSFVLYLIFYKFHQKSEKNRDAQLSTK